MTASLLPAAVFTVSSVALYTAHEVGDHWVQTHGQAQAKGGTGWTARFACARHVASLAAVKLLLLLVAFAVTGLPVRPAWWAAALGVDAVSHYWADRRTTLRWLAGLVGKGEFFDFGAPRPGHDDQPHLGTGAYVLDQAFHLGVLFLAALAIAAGSR